MIAIFDNLNAILIGSTVILVIMAMQMRMTEMSVEQTANYMMKRQAMDLATWMEDDLLLMGQNLPSGTTAYANPKDSSGITLGFEFYRDSVAVVGGTLDTMRITTRYELFKTGVHQTEKDTVDSFRLERWVQMGSGPWVREGGSSALLSHFKIEMLDRDALPVSDPVAHPNQVRNTKVSFHMVTPFETRRATLRRVYYGSTLMVRN